MSGAAADEPAPGADPGVMLLYVTAPDAEVAARLARLVVEAGVAACANVLPGILSVYRWQGAVETASECALIVKTASPRVEEAIALIRAAHPYEVPAIVAWPVSGGLPAFLDWVRTESAAGPG